MTPGNGAPRPEGGQDRRETDERIVEEEELQTFYLRDSQGRLVPLFEALTYEQWRELWRIYRRWEAPRPERRYSILSMTLRGNVKDGAAHLKATFRVKILQAGWARVPLRLNNTFLVKRATKGMGEPVIDFSEVEGYEWLINAEADSVHTLDLDLQVPLVQLGGETRLTLQTPKITTARLDLTAPGANVEVTQVEGGNVQSVKRTGGNTLMQLIGLGGELRLNWRDSRKPSAPLVMEARTNVRVDFDGKHHTRSDANIQVHALNGVVESFVVRLPAGMKLVPHDEELTQRRYRVAPLSEQRRTELGMPEPNPQSGELVEVELQSKSLEPIEVALRAVKSREAAIEADSQPTLVEASGFEVIGAAHQWGYIDVALDSQWNAHWVTNNVTRQDNIPAAVRQSGVMARFTFSQQPSSLKVRVTPKETRVRVEPLYLIYVSAREARLESRLRYRIRGVSDVSIHLEGWQVDAVTPENMIQSNRTDFESVEPFSIVLSPLSQQVKDELELRVLARQPLPVDGQFTLQLPRLQATASAPATVVILPDDNIKLTPLTEMLVGLEPEPLPPQLDLPLGAQNPLYYRVGNAETASAFSATLALRERVVTLESDVDLQIGAQQTRVKQTFNYHVAHEALTEAEFQVSPEVLRSGSLRFLLDDQPIIYETLPPTAPADDTPTDSAPADDSPEAVTDAEPAAPTPPNPWRRIRLELPGGRLQSMVLQASYSLSTPDSEAVQDYVIPLLLPATNEETTFFDWNLAVASEESVHLGLTPSAWRSVESGASLHAIAATSETPQREVGLRISSPPEEVALIVEKMWLQTWCSGRERRDRAVMHVQTTQDSVNVLLPPDVAADSVLAAVDGGRVLATYDQESRVVAIPIAASDSGDRHVLEIWYSFPGERTYGSLSVKPPFVEGTRRIDRFYWQLCLPAGEHLVTSPENLTAELAWRWQGLHWGRYASLSQADLENWIGASNQVPLPADSNQYLYSSFTPADTIRVYTVQRLYALILSSVLALAAGFALVYAPLMRHPAALMAVAVLIAVAAFYYPDAALLAAQAGSIGLALSAVAYLIDWGVAGRRVVRPVLSSPSRHTADPRSDALVTRLEVETSGSAATAPFEPNLGQEES